MAKTIYKYKLPRDGQSIIIKEHIVEVLYIGTQDGWPTLWAIVDTDYYQEIEVVAWGTGWPLPDDVYCSTDYWGSAIDGDGYVWHYFAELRSSDRDYESNDIYRVNDTTYYPLNSITTTPYSVSDVIINGDALNSKEWSFNLSQKTIDQLTKCIEESCNTTTNKCIQ